MIAPPNSSRPAAKESATSIATRDKLIEAAGRVFADRGYYAATVREICTLAEANVAAVNYHFGDKLGLYTEVLLQSKRAAHVDAVRNALEQDGSPEEVLRTVIRARLQSVRRGDLPDWHFRIMMHELAQPTPAMTQVINEVSRPLYKRMLELLGKILGPDASEEKIRLCVHSVMGQIMLYVLAGPMLTRLWPELKMTPEQVERIADHIADFSLAYLHSPAQSPSTGIHHRQGIDSLPGKGKK